MTEKSSLVRFRLERFLSNMASKIGRHTELITLYVPPDRRISDIMNNLRQEQSTASNIKSKTTRKNVLDAIERVLQRLRLFKRTPPNGLAIFCGAIPQNGPGSEKIEIYAIEPPEQVPLYYYRCDQTFHLDPLFDMLKEKETYGIIVIDGNNATMAVLKGRKLDIVKDLTSGLPGKHGRGGQSQRRFERLRETEVNDYYKRVGNHANNIFLEMPDFKGLIIGGPGPTKKDFEKGDYLQYTLKNLILTTVDTAYTGKGGVKEVVEKSPEILRKVRYFEERKLFQSFLYELGHDTGLAAYGEEAVRVALYKGNVRMIIISENYEGERVRIECTNCNHVEEATVLKDVTSLGELADKPCPSCLTSNLRVVDKRYIIEEIAKVADKFGASIEIISKNTEEGVELESFGGIVAILRYSQN